MSDFSENSGGDLLMIFTKNREEGKVKTRLAKDIGNKKALEVYELLLEHTRDVALEVGCFRLVFYSDFIDFDDLFDNQYFLKDEQADGDLGKRLEVAFEENFHDGFDKIICIGSDCFELNSNILKEAFDKLNDNDVVLGPAADGGYYLIGMNKLHAQLFRDKAWSTPNVMLDTMLDFKDLKLKYHLLPTLSDVDVLDDLSPSIKAQIL